MTAAPKPPASPLSRPKPIKRTSSLRSAIQKRIFREWKCKHCLTSNGGGYKKMTACEKCHIRRATKRTTLKARCDALARALCKRLADGKCAECGGVGTDWAHRMPRRHHSMRWDMTNCDLLCRPCHQWFTDNPLSFAQWLNQKIGWYGVGILERAANAPWDRDYTKVLKYLTEYKA